MELHQLECFLAVAETEHMTRAAERLHMTQPSLSKVIARLEADLGTTLFYREGRHIRLNEQGEVAKIYAQNILHVIDDMRVDVAEIADGSRGAVRMGSSYAIQESSWILECVRDFLTQRPQIHFQMQSYPPDQLASALLNREIDLAVSMQPLQSENRSMQIVWDELFQEPMGVIMSRHHRLAEKPSLSLADLAEERFFCNDANSDTKELTIRLCERAGFRPDITFECLFPSFIGESVSRGLGVSLISESGYERSNKHENLAKWEEDIIYRPVCETYCCRNYGIAYIKSRHLPRSVQDFREFLEDFIEINSGRL